ncbi:hypothetical protein ACWXWU_18490 [Shewanella sp. A14]
MLLLLQFVGANLGAHQLHQGNSNEDQNNHPHLQLTSEVIVLAECVDCACAVNGSTMHSEMDDHLHAANSTKTQQIDVCLDCQCHGGHIALVTPVNNVFSQRFDDVYSDFTLLYLPPEDFPRYRPPIA